MCLGLEIILPVSHPPPKNKTLIYIMGVVFDLFLDRWKLQILCVSIGFHKKNQKHKAENDIKGIKMSLLIDYIIPFIPKEFLLQKNLLELISE